MKNPYRLVRVKWQDSANPTTGWEFVSDVKKPDRVSCETVGWLIREGKVLTLAASIMVDKDGEHQANGIVSIPRRFIDSIDDLSVSEGLGNESSKVHPPFSGWEEQWEKEADKLLQEAAESPTHASNPFEVDEPTYSIKPDPERLQRLYDPDRFNQSMEMRGFYVENFSEGYWEKRADPHRNRFWMYPVIVTKNESL